LKVIEMVLKVIEVVLKVIAGVGLEGEKSYDLG
jgi:hypothetical protein